MTKKSDTHKTLRQALAAFQEEHGYSVAYDSKGYGYSYASLGAIVKSTGPILLKHGLVLSQCVETRQVGGGECSSSEFGVLTTLEHLHSEDKRETWIGVASVPSMKGMTLWQSMGSGASYLRRYAMSALLSIVTEEDKDAAAPQKSTEPYPQPKEAPKPVENEPYPSTKVTCPSCEEVSGMMEDKACWAKVGNDKKGTLRAMCGGCGHKFAVWA